MKRFAYLFAASLLSGALVLGSAGCSQLEAAPEDSSSLAQPSSQVAQEATPSPSPTASPTPSPSPTPESSQVADQDFETAFADNPIDQKLQDDLDLATSTSKIQQAYNDAAKRWNTLITTAYEQAQTTLKGQDLETVTQDQQTWESGLDASLEEIRSANSEDALTASEKVVDFYRQRAKEICQAIYTVTGQMPAFPDVGDGEPEG